MNRVSLIRESELREAMQLSPFDHDNFDRGVRERVAAGLHRVTVTEQTGEPPTGYLRVAASVLPIQLLGGATKVPTFAALGIAKQFVGYLALPVACLVMLIITFMGMRKIRQAQQSGTVSEIDLLHWQAAYTAWWWQYGWIAVSVFVLALLSPFLGWTTPLLIILAGSGVATVSLVVLMAKSGLVSRTLIGSVCLPMLGILAQVSLTYAMVSNRALLDPQLVTATLMLGITILACLSDPPAFVKDRFPSSRLARSVWLSLIVVFLGSFTAFYTQSLWRSFGQSAIVDFVESFPNKRHPDWRSFAISVQWLQEEGVECDYSKPSETILELLASEKTPGTHAINAASLLGLVPPATSVDAERVLYFRERWLDGTNRDEAILSLSAYEADLRTFANDSSLTDSQRDQLASRMIATWQSLSQRECGYDVLGEAVIVTECLGWLKRDTGLAQRRRDVAIWLEALQVHNAGVFKPTGGYAITFERYSSDVYATANAIRLMQMYGLPDAADPLGSVDFLALRASVRPNLLDHWPGLQSRSF